MHSTQKHPSAFSVIEKPKLSKVELSELANLQERVTTSVAEKRRKYLPIRTEMVSPNNTS